MIHIALTINYQMHIPREKSGFELFVLQDMAIPK
jgi:hypothetical protein